MPHSQIDPLAVSRANIDSMPQNRVRLIVGDLLRFGVPEPKARRVLMARGVNKWLGARRRIIDYTHDLKTEITNTIRAIRVAKRCKDHLLLAELRGKLKAKQEARAVLRDICHMPRWWPDDKGRYL